MIDQRTVLNALLRTDFMSFAHRCALSLNPGTPFMPNWHLTVLAEHLQAFAAGKTKRLIVNLPPRGGKSVYASIALPLWILGHDPTRRLICASYGAELASRFSRDTRTLMESAWVRALFPALRPGDKMTEEQLTTTRQGYRLAASVGGALTGLGGDYLIIDDPTKASDAWSDSARTAANDWFTNTALSRLDDKRTGGILIVMQRQHVDDLVGCVLDRSGEDWTVLSLPAIAQEHERFVLRDGRVFIREPGEALHPEREPFEVLMKLKRQLGTYDFSAQYLQQPVPIEGHIVKWGWFKTFAPPISTEPKDDIIQSWDTAVKGTEYADYSVCTTWLNRGDDHFLLDVYRERLNYPELKQAVIDLARRHGAMTVLIEDAGTGAALVDELQTDGPIRPVAVEPEGDKITRFSRSTRLIEPGYVHLPSTATWLQDFQKELLSFPNSRHDDQVDSVSQYLNWEGLTIRRERELNERDLRQCVEEMEREWEPRIVDQLDLVYGADFSHPHDWSRGAPWDF
jgi:predicted phage terminase large subunit-like protein